MKGINMNTALLYYTILQDENGMRLYVTHFYIEV